MHFSAEHRFDASPADVAAALVDASFYKSLELPGVGPPELVSCHALDGSGAGAIALRYEYTAGVDTLARGLLRGARPTWTQELSLERASGDQGAFAGTLEMHADANPALLHGRADMRLDPMPQGGTRRMIDGDLVVALPGFGGMAERRIVPGVLERLDVEAEALGRRLG